MKAPSTTSPKKQIPSSTPVPKTVPRPAIRPTATNAHEPTLVTSSPRPVESKAQTSPAPTQECEPQKQPVKSSGWQLVKLLKNRFGLFDTPKGLLLLHLRHADQRVRFEKIQKTFSETNPPSQGLLIPEPIELEPMAAATLKQHLDVLNQGGFRVEEFGRHFYRIEAIPAWLDQSSAASFLRDTVDALRQRSGSRTKDELAWQTVTELAAGGSYQKNDMVNEQTVQRLAEDLLKCDIPHTSPSGKPTYKELAWAEFERHFER